MRSKQLNDAAAKPLEAKLAAAQAVIAMGRTCLWRLREERRAIIDAHGEVAVPAYLHRCIKHLEDFAKQPADTAALDAAIAETTKPLTDWLTTFCYKDLDDVADELRKRSDEINKLHAANRDHVELHVSPDVFEALRMMAKLNSHLCNIPIDTPDEVGDVILRNYISHQKLQSIK